MYQGIKFSCIFLCFLLIAIEIRALQSSTSIPVLAHNSPTKCSAYCMMVRNADYNLDGMCSTTYTSGNGRCTQCDPLLFRAVGAGPDYQCIAHQYNGEANVYYKREDIKLGFHVLTDASDFDNVHTIINVPNLPPHHAIRIRFGVYLYKFKHPDYIYPFSYSIDAITYKYNNTLSEYWSDYDIVTSPLTSHTMTNVSINFRLLTDQTDYPYNYDADPACKSGGSNIYNKINGDCHCSYTYRPCNPIVYCDGLSRSSSLCNGYTESYSLPSECCQLRYIHITDMIVFAAKCQQGCLNCSSTTYCMICNINAGYYLYPEDHTCYKNCPQASYQDNMTYFLNNKSLATNESWCSTCNITCLECNNLTYCAKCYASGRNQSFLYNNTCINPCINGYTQNYTTHQCWCPLNYHYQINASLLCQPCSIQCVFCFGPLNLQCTYCQIGYYLVNLTTHCLLDCPVGQFKNDLTRKCFQCDRSCSDCQLQATLCTSCINSNPIKYLIGQQCLSWCPPGYSWNNITYKCDLCNLYTYSYEGKCSRFCPVMHRADKENRSCIHLSQYGYKFEIALINVNVLSHGKLLSFQVLFQDGLNVQSYNSLIKRSYFSVQILYKDQPIEELQNVRNLQSMNLPIKNIKYVNNRIYYTTNIPDNMDFRKSFQILFTQQLAGTQNINYQSLTNSYPIKQNPNLMKQYYRFSIRNLYYIIMIPFITIAMLLFTLQLKGVYELFMETFRQLQIIGLLVYSSFPMGQYAFYFLVGCSYSNLDFIPNLYGMAISSDKMKNLTSYFMAGDDMDFIRLNGSVLFFALLWGFIIIIGKFLFSISEKKISLMINFGLDLIEVKILHSFWSAIIYVIINYKAANISIFISFSFAIMSFLAILSRRYIFWKEDNQISPFFIWRLVSSLLISLLSLANELVVACIFTVALLIAIWQFNILHSKKYYININDLNSKNYLSQRTFKILNKYDQQIPYNWSVSIRNSMITFAPIIVSLVIAVIIFLRDSELESVIFSASILYFLLLLAIIIAIFIYNFLEERRKYLVQNKLEFLQKKYAKLNPNDTINYQERRRPRGANQHHYDQEKHFEQVPREMLKSYD